jgi:hypothetical protein
VSSRVAEVTVGVQIGQFSTSARISHTRSGAAPTRTVMSALTAPKCSSPGFSIDHARE